MGVIPPPPNDISFANFNGRITKAFVFDLNLVMLNRETKKKIFRKMWNENENLNLKIHLVCVQKVPKTFTKVLFSIIPFETTEERVLIETVDEM